MGIVLRKAFKGSHVWIPPLKDQLPDGAAPQMNIKLSDPSDGIKIDAMMFTATEEALVLVG